MNISLDYDNTYTRDPDSWDLFIKYFQSRGHTIYCVTARSNMQAMDVLNTIGELIGDKNCYFTNMQAKQKYMYDKGISIDVWIDDSPFFIVEGV
jgi:hypothetical protein